MLQVPAQAHIFLQHSQSHPEIYTATIFSAPESTWSGMSNSLDIKLLVKETLDFVLAIDGFWTVSCNFAQMVFTHTQRSLQTVINKITFCQVKNQQWWDSNVNSSNHSATQAIENRAQIIHSCTTAFYSCMKNKNRDKFSYCLRQIVDAPKERRRIRNQQMLQFKWQTVISTDWE